MKTTLISLWVAIAAINGFCQEAKITVHVTDENGINVTNAQVSAGFQTRLKPGQGWGVGKPNHVKGVTDTNGICVLSGTGDDGSVGVSVTKAGYYGSGGYGVFFTNLNRILQRWEPWNPTVEVLLKPIGTPVTMYARDIHFRKLPTEGKLVSFDLMAGDWVAPNGKGIVSDFLIQLDRATSKTITNRYGPIRLYDDRLTVTFSNEGDGIQAVYLPPRGGQSSLHLPRQAPLEGYEPILVKRKYRDTDDSGNSNIRDDANYFFRVRTKKDEKGNIVSALYGKIHGDLRGFGGGELLLTYYLNPEPNSRNMEFDPKKNLFKNLKPLERVTAP